jgi:hypothetical protein
LFSSNIEVHKTVSRNSEGQSPLLAHALEHAARPTQYRAQEQYTAHHPALPKNGSFEMFAQLFRLPFLGPSLN